MARIARVVAVVCIGLGCMPMTAVSAGKADPSSLATYNGRTIDLAVSWEGAEACWIAVNGNSCFDTEAEMDEAMDQGSDVSAAADGARPATTLADCATPVRLYKNTSMGGTPVLALTPRGGFLALSTYGFSSVTSSYSIGACSSIFQDGSSITYPGSTSAGSSATSMSSGWDNRITKVYIS